ncbi:tetratricopeptide repeat protein [Campylobacter sp. MOP51]|uniref:tetratricopeptide repeat protein n=1 Tax=Campylobacter canis TaxID=3378588 RepID=UPI003C32D344
MKKICTILSIVGLLISPSIANHDIAGLKQLNQAQIQEFQGEAEPLVYKKLIEAIKMSNHPQQLAVLGALYAFGAQEPDSVGDTIPQNIPLAEKHLLQSRELGNKEANIILGSLFYFHIGDMKKAELYLNEAYKNGDLEAGVILADLFDTIGKDKEGLDLLLKLAERRLASAEMALAFIFKDGLIDNNGTTLVEKNKKTAEFFLTRACTNPKQTEKIMDFCNNPELVRK